MDSFDRPSEVGRAAAANYLGPPPIGAARGSRFPVSATVVRGASVIQCRGELLISADAVVFSPFASGRRSGDAGELIHSDRNVTVTVALLRPPWANTFLVLHDRHSQVRVGTSWLARRKLVRELNAAGMAVEARTASSPPELTAAQYALPS